MLDPIAVAVLIVAIVQGLTAIVGTIISVLRYLTDRTGPTDL